MREEMLARDYRLRGSLVVPTVSNRLAAGLTDAVNLVVHASCHGARELQACSLQVARSTPWSSTPRCSTATLYEPSKGAACPRYPYASGPRAQAPIG